MPGKAVISLTTGLEDAEKVTVAYLVAVGAAETGRPTLMFPAKEAVRLAVDGTAVGVACEGCPPLADLQKRYEAAGGHYYVCPICFNTKKLDAAGYPEVGQKDSLLSPLMSLTFDEDEHDGGDGGLTRAIAWRRH
jgi:predicted peroxiredoxin